MIFIHHPLFFFYQIFPCTLSVNIPIINNSIQIIAICVFQFLDSEICDWYSNLFSHFADFRCEMVIRNKDFNKWSLLCMEKSICRFELSRMDRQNQRPSNEISRILLTRTLTFHNLSSSKSIIMDSFSFRFWNICVKWALISSDFQDKWFNESLNAFTHSHNKFWFSFVHLFSNQIINHSFEFPAKVDPIQTYGCFLLRVL